MPSDWRMPELLALLVFLLSLGATFGAWHVVDQQIERSRQAEFDFQTRQAVRRIAQRMDTYEQVERDTQAFLLGSMDVKRADFRLFVQSIRLEERFPGIQGLALVELIEPASRAAHLAAIRGDGAPGYDIRPAGVRPMYTAISHIEPFTGLNLRALGYDMFSDPTRRAAMERARDSGQAAASGKVRLVQENGRNVQSGFVMYLPIYRRGMPNATVEERRQHLVGWVGAPFRMDDLMAGLGGERSSEITLSIYDGGTRSDAARLFRSGVADLQPPRFRPRYRAIRNLTIAGAPWTLDVGSTAELESRLDDNRPRWIAAGGSVASGVLAFLVWALGTGQRRAVGLARRMTRQLSDSEYRWKYALEGAGDGVWDWDRGSGAILYSRQWKAMLGYAEDELGNTEDTWRNLIHPDDVATVSARLQAYLDSTSGSWVCEYRMRSKDGGYRWILARGMAVTRTATGRPVRTIGTHADITRVKESENAMRVVNAQLAHEQHRFDVILQHSHDAFVAVGSDGYITHWNASAERMFGWSTFEAIGAPMADLIVPPEFRARHTVGFQRFIQSGRGAVTHNVIEVTAMHRSGRQFPAELAVAGFPEGVLFAVSSFIRDISERKASERSAAERSQALEDARQALQHAQKLEAVGKLTGGIAHDFNNVLQIISGNVQLLQHYPPNEASLQQRLRSIGSAVARGSKLSSQLLAFARRQPLQPAAINPLRTLRDRDDLLQRALGEGIGIEYRYDEALWNVFVDAGQLENVVMNLAINARDAMSAGGLFSLEFRNRVVDAGNTRFEADVTPGEYVHLSLSDTGCGMTEEVMAHAFEPFFTTKPVGQGTGLGLSMAYGFVKQSGGHITLRSKPGVGTTIDILLPRSYAMELPAQAPPGVDVTGGEETILVVEDDGDVRLTAVGMLRQLGYRVIDAADGAAALAILERGERIDLLFTDVVMPGTVSSTDLAAHARRLLPGVAVLFTSGYTRDALAVGGRIDGSVQLLSKPYQQAQLAQRLRDILGARLKIV
ncbi:MAG: diguanylate cyclase [Massilia sp.]|nr:diguanylate cyclase [Massilia sp.]